jgi:hypothetical protein
MSVPKTPGPDLVRSKAHLVQSKFVPVHTKCAFIRIGYGQINEMGIFGTVVQILGASSTVMSIPNVSPQITPIVVTTIKPKNLQQFLATMAKSKKTTSKKVSSKNALKKPDSVPEIQETTVLVAIELLP